MWVYGFDVVERYRKQGWRFDYVLHNHTLQKNGDRLALGVTVPSTSDIQLARGLAETIDLENVRVTNGPIPLPVDAPEVVRKDSYWKIVE